MTQNELRLEIQKYIFAAHDMQLYLDTHPKDEKAFSVFRTLVQKANELKADYLANYGPLSVNEAINYDSYVWNNGPWPWEKGGNA